MCLKYSHGQREGRREVRRGGGHTHMEESKTRREDHRRGGRRRGGGGGGGGCDGSLANNLSEEKIDISVISR